MLEEISHVLSDYPRAIMICYADVSGWDEDLSKSRSRPKSATDSPYWLIEGFAGLEKIHEWRIDARHISTENVQSLLRVLAGKVGLTLDEIVSAHLNGRARSANSLLQVARDSPHMRFTCGQNPYFIAVYRRSSDN